MNRVIINLESLRHNMEAVDRLMNGYGASWSVVTKALCGHADTIKALRALGANSVADSRLDNLRAVGRTSPDLEKWYLRLPHLSVADDVIELADISLNTEEDVIAALSDAAARQNKIHRVVIMVELGDLREGILPSSLIDFYRAVFSMRNIEVIGVGAQVGCLSGSAPNVDQVAHLLLYRELLELKFEHKLPIVSAGSSIFLPLLMDGRMPRGVNHFRVGEALFLGTDLMNGGTLPGFRDDVVRLEAEIAEIKEKSLVPMGETVDSTPFEQTPGTTNSEPPAPGQRGYRALVTVGGLDTDVSGLTPTHPDYQIAGASSDITVINLGDQPGEVRIGNTIRFSAGYSAFVQLMNDPYIAKHVEPPLDEFERTLERWDIEVSPAMPDPPRDIGPKKGTGTGE